MKLGNFINITSGFAFSSGEFNSDNNGMPLIRIRDVMVNYSDTYFSGEYDNKYVVKKDDLLVTMDGEFKINRWKGKDGLLNQRVCRIEPDENVILQDYLLYCLPAELYRIEEKTPFVTVKHLSVKKINEIEIEIPSIEEQRNIIEKLNQVRNLIEKRNTSIQKLDELLQSVFYDMFGDLYKNSKKWPVVELMSLINDVQNGITRRRKEHENKGNIVLRLRDIRTNEIDYSEVNRIPLTEKEIIKYKLRKGELLFIRVNGNPDYVGRCAIFSGSNETICYNDHIMRVRLNVHEINPIFISYLLNTEYGKSQIALHRKTSAGQHTISQDGLNKIKLPLPPIDIQNKFEEFMNSSNLHKNTNLLSLNKMNDLFQSLLHQSFNGEAKQYAN